MGACQEDISHSLGLPDRVPKKTGSQHWLGLTSEDNSFNPQFLDSDQTSQEQWLKIVEAIDMMGE